MAAERTWRVALTGGAGTGKSTVAQMFAERGIPVTDADALAHEFMEPGQEANARIRALFGSGITDSEGHIDRPALRRIVFADLQARRALEAVLHPLIRNALRARSEGACPYALLVIPLLAENGRPPFVDRIAVVDTDPKLQRARLRERQLNPAAIDQLLAIQATRAQRLAMADDILVNKGSREELRARVAALDERYRQIVKNRPALCE
ncbi:MAG: dephospho-CoA kinase [Gammaproteobacteria bacterium]|nr:dephospho-CoA kinase [Gammaproteobacteria bacterium]